MIKIRTKVFPGPQNLALFVAEAKGYFDKHEIDAEVLARRRSCAWRPSPESESDCPSRHLLRLDSSQMSQVLERRWPTSS